MLIRRVLTRRMQTRRVQTRRVQTRRNANSPNANPPQHVYFLINSIGYFKLTKLLHVKHYVTSEDYRFRITLLKNGKVE